MDAVSIDLKKPCHAYFMGIDGVNTNGLAEVLRKEGFPMGGGDAKGSGFIEHLKTRDIQTYIGQQTKNFSSPVDYTIYTMAIHPDDPEFRGTRRQSVPVLGRAELLG